MTLDDIPNILKSLPDSDCTPNIICFPRRFQAPRPSSQVIAELIFKPADPDKINHILEVRTQRPKRVLKPISSDVIETVWIPTTALEIGQAFMPGESLTEQVKMIVTRKTDDLRNPGQFWIHTTHAELKSFHTTQITRVKIAKIAPKPEAPVLVSIGKPITQLNAADFESGNLPTDTEAVAMWQSEVINTEQYRAISRAIRLHQDPEMFLAIEMEAAKLA